MIRKGREMVLKSFPEGKTSGNLVKSRKMMMIIITIIVIVVI